MSEVTIKFNRSIANDIPSYGKEFNRLLNELIGGEEKWDKTDSHGIATIPGIGVRVQRYETGPEITEIIVPAFATVIAAVAPLIFKWLKPGKINDPHKIIFKCTKNEKTIEITVFKEEDIQQLVTSLRSLC